MRKGVDLLYRQGVHVGTQADGTVSVAVTDHAHHTGGTDAAVHLNAPLRELLRHHLGRAIFLKRQLGVRVNVTPHRGNVGSIGQNVVDHFHDSAPYSALV